MDEDTTFDIRVYKTDVYKGARVTTYKVRWKTGHRLWKEGFRNAALADSFRSSLLTAARNGEPFSVRTGRPVSWKSVTSQLSPGTHSPWTIWPRNGLMPPRTTAGPSPRH